MVSVILAKSALSLSDIGRYEIWMYIGLIFTLFCYSGSLQAIAALYPKLDDKRQPRLLGNAYLAIWIAAIVLALGVWIFQEAFARHFLHITDLDRLGGVLIFLLLHLSASIVPYVLLLRDRTSLFLPYAACYGVGFLSCVILPLWLGGGLDSLLHWLIGFGLLEQVVTLRLLGRYARWRPDASILRQFLAVGVPLTLYGSLGLLAQVFDAWLVTLYYPDLATFAVFKYGARELPGAIALAGAFTTAMVVAYAQSTADGLARMRRGTRRLMHIFFPLATTLMLLSPILFRWIYNEAFVESAIIFNTYLLLMISRWLFPHAILIADNQTNVLLAVGVIELLVNVLLSFALIGSLGLWGVALATVVAFLLEKLILVLWVRLRRGIGPSAYVPRAALVYYSLGLLTAYALTFVIYPEIG